MATSLRPQALDQLNLPRVIHRMARDAEDHVEWLDVFGRPHPAGANVGDRRLELSVLRRDELENPLPRERRFIGELEPVFAFEREWLGGLSCEALAYRPRRIRVMHRDLGDVVSSPLRPPEGQLP